MLGLTHGLADAFYNCFAVSTEANGITLHIVPTVRIYETRPALACIIYQYKETWQRQGSPSDFYNLIVIPVPFGTSALGTAWFVLLSRGIVYRGVFENYYSGLYHVMRALFFSHFDRYMVASIVWSPPN